MKLNKLDFLKPIKNEQKKSYSINKIEQCRNNNINNRMNTINSYYYLPPIDKNIKRLAFQKPTSILNKFITKHSKDIINYTENDINNVIIIQNKYKNEELVNRLSRSYKNMILKTEEKKSRNRIFKIKPNEKLNKTPLGALLTNINKNEKQNNNEYIENDSLNISEDNFININELYNKHKEENISKKKIIINSVKRNSKMIKDNSIKLSSSFRRMCSYQPDIKINWKYKYGLKYNLGNQNDFKIANKDINYQSNIIESHYKLLLNDIDYYQKFIIKNINYYSSFEGLSLTQKINYNKALEETIGILTLLPKMLLNDFYDLIKNLYDTKIPKMIKFENKYVFDEMKQLKYNNKLFVEVYNFSHNIKAFLKIFYNSLFFLNEKFSLNLSTKFLIFLFLNPFNLLIISISLEYKSNAFSDELFM